MVWQLSYGRDWFEAYLRKRFPLSNLIAEGSNAEEKGLRYIALHWISIIFYWFKISNDRLLCLMEKHLHFLFHFTSCLHISRLTSQGQFFKIIGSEALRVCCRVSAHLLIKGLPNPHIPWAPFVDLSHNHWCLCSEWFELLLLISWGYGYTALIFMLHPHWLKEQINLQRKLHQVYAQLNRVLWHVSMSVNLDFVSIPHPKG